MTRMARHCATIVAALAVSACAGGSEIQDGPAPSTDRTAKVQVENNNWADMTVMLEKSGYRVRLGTVTSMTRTQLSVPRNFLVGSGGVRVVLDPIGGSEAYRTETVDLWPGQVLDLKIQNHLGISSVSVWNQ